MSFTGPLADRVGIRELLETYADAVNRNDAEAWGVLWSDDATWSIPDEPDFGTIQGRDQIVAVWKMAMTRFAGVVFIVTPGAISIEGTDATVRSYTSEVFNDPVSGRCHRDLGLYEDELRKTDGVWRFQRRTFRYLKRDLG